MSKQILLLSFWAVAVAATTVDITTSWFSATVVPDVGSGVAAVLVLVVTVVI